MLNFKFNPVRYARQNLPSYNSVPPDDYSYSSSSSDLEKRPSLDYSSEYNSSPESRSAHPRRMLARHSSSPSRRPRTSSAKRKASAYTYRSPRRYGRYFTLALFTTLVIFILSLVRNSYNSAWDVQNGRGKPPPQKPAWEEFKFLKRNYGGIRTLVDVKKNKPEYPLQDDEVVAPAPAAPPAEQPKQDQEKPGSEESGQQEKQDNKQNLRKRDSRPIPDSEEFDPYPKEGRSDAHECFLDEANTVRIPKMRTFHGVPQGMPDNIMGSYDIFGMRNDICFERFGRYGPYGVGYSKKRGGTGAGMEGDREGAEKVWSTVPEIDFVKVNWASAQRRCAEGNRHRFMTASSAKSPSYQSMPEGNPPEKDELDAVKKEPEKPVENVDTPTLESKSVGNSTSKLEPRASKILLPRTAVLIRTWQDYHYDPEDVVALRALISELSIGSSGEYTVHFLIHVKDDNLPIWSDEATYQTVLNQSLPAEFHGMGTLWTERQMGLIYGGLAESMYRDLPVHGAYRSTFMPVTYFAHLHPEYEYFWQWEMDVRFIGHYYDLFSKVSKWADAQPRKLLWERSSRFYVPHVHGSWDDFKHMVRVQTEHGTANKNNVWATLAKLNPDIPESAYNQPPETPIWGPEKPLDDILDNSTDPIPPHSDKKDHDEWGVGEPADLIVFNPLFDPHLTNWILAEDVTGYNTTRGLPPRRTAINTSGRYSKRLLATMHRDTSLGRKTMFSEMWPATTALHHGLKAVYAPHPVYIDRTWPPQYLAAIFNGGRNGASGGARTSVFSDERQHNFLGTTWYYHAGHAPNLWRRWLGYKVDGGGGEAEEVSGEGRMCFRSVLLHPIKDAKLVVLKSGGDKDEPQS
ncbi:hypothetical protein K402DRAFT_392293 [Aulographum hederae CBS 113979]|uniref:Uncharacterized protein n=1 Tax=Aulographum hederae CBS 113979 TaxID=1176131 RepID=A0A6G1H4S7_9PEZI|nr:hypothetical protein K402DRAFT_392293 [Aulographum hederae CBS 113979]